MRLDDTHNVELFTECVWTIRTMSSCSRNEMCSYVEREVGEVKSQQAVTAHECVHIFVF